MLYSVVDIPLQQPVDLLVTVVLGISVEEEAPAPSSKLRNFKDRVQRYPSSFKLKFAVACSMMVSFFALSVRVRKLC